MVDTDGGSAADSVRIDAEVVVRAEDAEARMTHTACDKEGAEVDAEDDERDAPTGAVLSNDEGADVGADEWDDVLVAERDVEVAEEVDRMCDAEPEGGADSRGQVVAAEGRWSQSGDGHMSWTNPRAPAWDRSPPIPQYSEVDWVPCQSLHLRPSDASDHVHAPSLLHAQAACGRCSEAC